MKKDIAIIGMSGKFPKSDSVREFWQNLVLEKELVHFFKNEELMGKGVDKKIIDDSTFIMASAFIDSAGKFDYPFFKYTLDEAKVMNPQTRMMHQLVWEALEDASCNFEEYPKKIGIYIGANKDLNWDIHSVLTKNENVDGLLKAKLSDPKFMASLISYKLNFKGPCYYLDTACSTSLSAVHLACRSMLLKECGIAVVGGIRLLSREHNGYQFNEGSIMSKDGHTRSFDSDSSGTIFSDGAGVVILKRLEDALEENDNIYAVIKGSAMNNDGNSKAGYTMPSIQGQSECIRLAQKIAGVSPTEISYVETHGTGTRIGDPIEIESLNLAFQDGKTHKCAIGSVKSNMGHADEAAGIIGLIKTALALKSKVIPASLHFSKSNPSIDFKSGPFYVNTTSKKWERGNKQLLTAGVSSFGIGGTNVHVIVQEVSASVKKSNRHPYKLIRYSANTLESLENYEARLLDFILHQDELDIASLAYTLQIGRKQFDYRKFAVIGNIEELKIILQSGHIKTYTTVGKEKIVFMFPGQGSQYVQMGKQLYKEVPLFRTLLDRGFSVLEELSGINYKEILLGKSKSKINNTQFTQPILFLFEHALATLLLDLGIQPSYLIGHSLGEYTAACLSGVFSFEDALKIVVKRAELMAKAPKGKMVSVGTSLDAISSSIFESVSIAAINSPDSFVISGSGRELNKVIMELKNLEIPYSELKTSHAFHSEMMMTILDDFALEFKDVSLSNPKIPFISNVTGDFITAKEASSMAYWKNHIVATVNFERGIEKLIEQESTLFIEVGPGKTLSTFFRQCKGLNNDNAIINMVRHPKEQIDDCQYFTSFLGKLWTFGFDIDWVKYYGENIPFKASIPTYTFDAYDLPTKAAIEERYRSGINFGFEKMDLSECFYVPSWKYLPKVSEVSGNSNTEVDCLFFTDSSIFSESLRDEVIEQGKNVIEIVKGTSFKIVSPNRVRINPMIANEYQKLLEHLGDIGFSFDLIVYGWDLARGNRERNGELEYKSYTKTFDIINAMIKGLGLNEAESKKKIVFIGNTINKVTGAEKTYELNKHVGIFLKILTQEAANIHVIDLDFDLDTNSSRYASQVLSELEADEKYIKIAYRNGRRWLPYYESLKAPNENKKQLFKEKGVYMITGNFDKIGYTIANYLVKKYDARVFICDSKPTGEPEYDELKQNIQNLNNIVNVGCDITDYKTFSLEVENLENRYGEINGVIHAARNIGAGELMLANSLSETVLNKQFSIKVNGLLVVDKIFKDKKLDFLTVFSSICCFTGGVLYGAYAIASTLMDEILLDAIEDGSKGSVINLDNLGHEDQAIHEDELMEILEYAIANEVVGQLILTRKDLNAKVTFTDMSDSKPQQSAKIDRKNLRSLFEAPTNEIEIEIIAMFEDLFGMHGIGIEDDFFELGGDSLKGIPLINKLKKKFSIQISLKDFFNNPTVELLASLIDNRKWLATKPQTKNEVLI